MGMSNHPQSDQYTLIEQSMGNRLSNTLIEQSIGCVTLIEQSIDCVTSIEQSTLLVQCSLCH